MQKRLTYTAICIALATVLSYVKILALPMGGSVTLCSMFFITIVGYWFGSKTGIIAGIIYGLLQLAFGGNAIISPLQVCLDYIFAFGLLGISGVFRNMKYGLQIGYIVAVFARFLSSFLSGIIYYGSYAPEGMGIAIYSFLYNISYILPEMLITLLLISIPALHIQIDRIKKDVAI